MAIKGWNVLILARKSPYTKELVIHITVGTSLCCIELCCRECGLQAVLWGTNRLAVGQTQPAHCNRGA